MRILTLVFALLTFAGAALAQTAQVTGTLGYLSEWKVSADVAQTVVAGRKEFAGPLTVTHVGVCTPGRPVEMSGEIHYQITGWTRRRMKGTLVLDGVECGFDATLSDRYEGALSCPQWHGVPFGLSVKPVE
jgi:hypothetical protein